MTYDKILNQKDTISETILAKIDPEHTKKDAPYTAKSLRDIRYTIRYVVEGLKNDSPAIIIHYFRWLRKTLAGIGIDPDVTESLFDAVKETLTPHLSEKDRELLFDIDTDDFKKKPANTSDTKNGDRDDTYLSYLLDKNKTGAIKHLEKLHQDGMSIEKIHNDVIKPAMYEIGTLWQEGSISVADEHLATVITQYAMTILYPSLFSGNKKEVNVIGAAIGPDLHEIGIRMVTDRFEAAGYQTHYLGANTPKEALVSYAKDNKPALIALGITLPVYLSEMRETIRALRAEGALKDVKILIGGQPFLIDSGLIETMGADGYAEDASEALKVGEDLAG